MEVKEMKELIAAVSSANVDEFEYNNEEFSIRIAKKKAKIATVDASVAGVPVQSAAIMPEQNEEQPEELLYGDEIKAPLVGTFYVAPSEGAEPFVSVGDKVIISCVFPDNISKCLNQFIAGFMPICIVDLFEIIQIHLHHTIIFFITLVFLKYFIHILAISHICECIVMNHKIKFIIPLLQHICRTAYCNNKVRRISH